VLFLNSIFNNKNIFLLCRYLNANLNDFRCAKVIKIVLQKQYKYIFIRQMNNLNAKCTKKSRIR